MVCLFWGLYCHFCQTYPLHVQYSTGLIIQHTAKNELFFFQLRIFYINLKTYLEIYSYPISCFIFTHDGRWGYLKHVKDSSWFNQELSYQRKCFILSHNSSETKTETETKPNNNNNIIIDRPCQYKVISRQNDKDLNDTRTKLLEDKGQNKKGQIGSGLSADWRCKWLMDYGLLIRRKTQSFTSQKYFWNSFILIQHVQLHIYPIASLSKIKFYHFNPNKTRLHNVLLAIITHWFQKIL